MYLLLHVDKFLTDVLDVKYKEELYSEISKITCRSKRQVSEYFRRKQIPATSFFKIQSWMSENRLTISDDELMLEAGIAYGWKGILLAFQRNVPEFIPKTVGLIQNLAEADLSFLRSVRKHNAEDRFRAFQAYLQDEVVPTYCIEPEPILLNISQSTSFTEINYQLGRIFIEGVLHILSHAEAEYLQTTCVHKASVLAKCLPVADNGSIISPSQRFFAIWMQALELKPEGVVLEMLDTFGEAGISDQDVEADSSESVSRDAVEIQIRRYVKEGKKPSWVMLDKWTKGLFVRAIEIQKREESLVEYSQMVKDLYGGVRILDMLWQEGIHHCSQEELHGIMSTYAIRYEKNMTEIKREAG